LIVLNNQMKEFLLKDEVASKVPCEIKNS